MQVVKYDIIFKVGEKNNVGFDIGTDALRFGTVPLGASASRNITIENNGNKAIVQLEVNENIKDWIILSENNFLLSPYENKTIIVQLEVPEQAETGNYTGTLKILFNRPRLF